jgi:hypothetical protein
MLDIISASDNGPSPGNILKSPTIVIMSFQSTKKNPEQTQICTAEPHSYLGVMKVDPRDIMSTWHMTHDFQ